VISRFTHEELKPPETLETPRISNSRYLASFNWLKGESSPTIVVPGEFYVANIGGHSD
jgi:hypothetical protein